MKTYYTMKEVATYCSKSHSMLYQLLGLGQLPKPEAITSKGLQLWSEAQAEKIKAMTAKRKVGRPKKTT